MFRFGTLVPILLGFGFGPVSARVQQPPEILFVLDASGSMWGQIEGENKIVIARRVLRDLIEGLPDNARVGLVAYGHRQEGDCADIETVVPMGPLDRSAITAHIDGLNPKGKTPITAALQEAFQTLGKRDQTTTVILVSDGLETCNADPCQAVKTAKTNGISFVTHVVGFDVGEDDVSQLECVAQAGSGSYFAASNAGELADALEQAVIAPDALPDGRLSVKAIAGDELVDVTVIVTRSVTGEEAAKGRTYTHPETNPRILPLEDGTYNVEVKAVRLKGNISRTLNGIEITDGGLVEKVVDFSSGELAIKVTRNGKLSDATVNVMASGTKKSVARGRTYAHAKSNPKVFKLTSGSYDIEIKSVEISGNPSELIQGVTVDGGKRVERDLAWFSGTLRAGAISGEKLIDASVHVINSVTGKAVAQGRTYAHGKTNPKVFELSPGPYRLKVKPIKGKGEAQELNISIQAGKTIEHMIDFGQ